MHDVIFDALDLDGLKRSGSDVQRDASSPNPPALELLEQLRREVQPRGRRRDGARPAGVDRLVALAIDGARSRVPSNVRWKRHLTAAFQ